ncbi:MAG: SUMF1/EgtB/PvdO family nonheme iron enzyme [Deltaproteobacteria bacterium]|nr:SUMF1/EgtB/PvdO family nonheme iron enzyme [Deltaproteobacteria bacterium]
MENSCFIKIVIVLERSTLIVLALCLFTYCSVDYSLLEEKYCSSTGECASGFVCDENTKKCVRNVVRDVGDRKDFESFDIKLAEVDDLKFSDVEDVWDYVERDVWDYVDVDFEGVDAIDYDVDGDIGSKDIIDVVLDIIFDDATCVDECVEEGKIECVSQTDFKICKRQGGCLIYETGYKCESNQYCDINESKCKEQVCKPGEVGCDNNKAYKCNPYGSDFDYVTDCTNQKKVCNKGECIECKADCTGKCAGEDDGCFGKCPDPCNGKGSCSGGNCYCNVGYAPPNCNKCAEGYTGYPDCVRCGGNREPCCENNQCSNQNLECVYGVCRHKCPNNMVRIGSSDVCIDSFEASRDGNKAASVKGVLPWANIAKVDAQNACGASGKRLCTISEWSSACKGPNNYLYPYGNAYEPKRCVDLNANDRCNNGDGTGVMPTGSRVNCEGGYPGIFDMSGNVWEWVLNADGSGCKLMGGSVDCCNRGSKAAECLSCNSLETQRCDLQWPGLGFRCCKDVP